MDGCYYISVNGWAFGWTQSVPLLFDLVSTVLTAATSETLYLIFAFYLYIPQYIVWVMQRYFQYVRPDPICQLYHTWAFPSMECMYIGAIFGAYCAYAYYWTPLISFLTWDLMFACVILPPVILIYTSYNYWWEIAFSLGFGLLSGILFVVIMRLFVKPDMAYLRLHFPFRTMGYIDSLVHHKSDSKSAEILKSLKRVWHDSVARTVPQRAR